MTTASPAPTTPTGRWPAPPLVSASVGLHATAAAVALLAPASAPWALATVALNHAALGAAGLWPRSALLGPNVTRLPPAAIARGGVALTIDDGPDPEVTPRVLDLLDQLGAKASFFCIAERALAQPALTREIVRRGHCVQNHSLRHSHWFSLLGPRALAREVGRAQDALADLLGERPHCFRAPAGLRNPFLDPVLHRLRLHLVSWSRRGFDTRNGDPSKVLTRLGQTLAAGDILLLHDGHAGRTPGGQPMLLAVLPALLAQCRAAGLQPLHLRDALPPRGDAWA